MSKMDTQRKNLKISKKLSLHRETLRTLSAQVLEEVGGGATRQLAEDDVTSIPCTQIIWTCFPL